MTFVCVTQNREKSQFLFNRIHLERLPLGLSICICQCYWTLASDHPHPLHWLSELQYCSSVPGLNPTDWNKSAAWITTAVLLLLGSAHHSYCLLQTATLWSVVFRLLKPKTILKSRVRWKPTKHTPGKEFCVFIFLFFLFGVFLTDRTAFKT